jgi:hypothetical protein
MKTEYSESAISFAENKEPIAGIVATAYMDRPGGRKVVIAHICEEYDANAQRKMYRTYDVDGKEILAPNANLAQIKKEIRRNEQLFHEQVALKEQAAQQDLAEEQRKRHLELRRIRSSKTQSRSHTR